VLANRLLFVACLWYRHGGRLVPMTIRRITLVLHPKTSLASQNALPIAGGVSEQMAGYEE
jgi:hypothetical protein